MDSPLPVFVHCISSSTDCQSELADCCARSRLEQSAESIYSGRPAGTNALSSHLRQNWGVKDPTQAATAGLVGKKLEIYIPPCGTLLEAALAISTDIATEQNCMFQHVIDKGQEPPTLSCLIRIDDRLAAPPCCSDSNLTAKMARLKDMLKDCQSGTPFGFNVWPVPGVTSGTWFAHHFDIPYLDQRHYQQSSNFASSSPSGSAAVGGLREILSRKAHATGILVLMSTPTVVNCIDGSSQTGANAAARDWFMFEVQGSHREGGECSWTYAGEYPLARPKAPEGPEEYHSGLQESEALAELKTAAKGLFNAGLKFGKSKLGEFRKKW